MQKLFSASAKDARGNGEGDGESEGHEVADRRYDPWLAEGGWMYTGVMGGVAERHSRPAERISEKTSPSQPCLTPSMVSLGKMSRSGVGRISELDGGLLTVLPDDDRGGVAGVNE